MEYIAVDFDGTVVTHDYPRVGKELEGCVDTLMALVDAGHKIIINTMRSGAQLQDAVDWYKGKGIPVFGVNNNPTQSKWTQSPKVYAHLYIDDAALGCPVIHNQIFHSRPYVDWEKVRSYLYNNDFINYEF